MTKRLILLLPVVASFTALAGCAHKSTTVDAAKLEKFPQCYNKNVKLSNACISKNEAGESVTAMDLENAAYPGQYK